MLTAKERKAHEERIAHENAALLADPEYRAWLIERTEMLIACCEFADRREELKVLKRKLEAMDGKFIG